MVNSSLFAILSCLAIENYGRDPRCRTNRWGVDLAYEDALGQWHEVSPETERSILAAMGVDRSDATGGDERRELVLVLHDDEERSVDGSGTLRLESGASRHVTGRLPTGLPHGYHQLELNGAAQPIPVIVAPRHCFLPPDLKTWGWSVQLYAARSRASWGIGDFYDLRQLAHWSKTQCGAGMMLLNPLCAATPVSPIQGSPYYPATRLFLSPLALHIPGLPGVSEIWPSLEPLDRQGRELNEQRLIDRDRIHELKTEALEILWQRFGGDPDFNRFCLDRGEALDRFAVFCAIAEHHRAGWHCWPHELQHPKSPAVGAFEREHSRRVLFHKWVQWLLDLQLSQSADLLDLMQDLPIGVDPDGADAWAWQDVLAQGAAVGAPPDEFNTQGQNWGLPPFVPHKLRECGYQPFVQTIRAAFRHCHALRIDHVMGLFRLFWIPQGSQASQGAYVRYDEREMLSIVALESERAHAYVVGEDLGTVEEGARETLASFQVLSYRLLWFEKQKPSEYPVNALAAVTTHDLPTVAGMWTGSDLERQRELGLKPNDESTAEIHERLCATAGLDQRCSLHEVIGGTYQLLSSAPSRVLTACLDDALAVEERPNIPATTNDKNPNWSLALPKPIEEIMTAPLASKISRVLSERNN